MFHKLRRINNKHTMKVQNEWRMRHRDFTFYTIKIKVKNDKTHHLVTKGKMFNAKICLYRKKADTKLTPFTCGVLLTHSCWYAFYNLSLFKNIISLFNVTKTQLKQVWTTINRCFFAEIWSKIKMMLLIGTLSEQGKKYQHNELKFFKLL